MRSATSLRTANTTKPRTDVYKRQEFNRGEFGVVLGGHALVAEDAADFINPVHAADDQALQRQFSHNTHIHIDVERIGA